MAREYNVMFLETSAKNGLNVNIAFTSIARYYYIEIKKQPFAKKCTLRIKGNF